MATAFKKTPLPRVREKITSDVSYWKNLEFPVTNKEFSAVTHIDFSQAAPYDFAVTSSTRVQVYNSRTNKPDKTFSKFREVAYGGSFRDDGKLLVAGGDEGVVRLFDVERKALLRVFKGHKSPVHVTKFTADNFHLVSGADDTTFRLWDIPGEREVISYSEHQDYIRTGVTSRASKDIVVSGSYDHTVKLYDTRTDTSVLTVDHGQPVESVLMYPGGGLFISAGGNYIKVWDALAGGRLLTQFSNHHKTITSMCFSSSFKRLLSGGVDRHVKIYDVATYQVVHTLDYPAAVLSLGVAPDDSVIAVGMADGLLSVQHRKAEKETITTQKKKKKASYKYVLRGKTFVPSNDDHVVQHNRRVQLAKYDKYFKKFEYTKALDAALDLRVRIKSPEVTIGVMQELIRRAGLKAALAGRDDKSLGVVLKFIQKNISNAKFTVPLIDVANTVLDLYSSQLGQSTVIDETFARLKETVDQEVSYIKQLLEVMGTMDTLFAASVHNQTMVHQEIMPGIAHVEAPS
ncbi:U3 small nucleolar RNA-associated protein 15 homolog [Lingula anatina]|uniref:U3 small nucleolar RNA-associated protein 15 homolog n=1 Tax=Lingula anatina TaxID=7574 RepID=A0A1S3JWH9_LINAN|nr:U3 small nucleolar RNA-associated protein 15 homolog [Lingula anatina]|eukprot:XP_013414421.1 U3 small nucleolar RNA-associated protein 15 homolog [Lingula anatina]